MEKLVICKNISIDKSNALIIFDEIGECQAGIDSLKFWQSNALKFLYGHQTSHLY
jgi:hypothetical protein